MFVKFMIMKKILFFTAALAFAAFASCQKEQPLQEQTSAPAEDRLPIELSLNLVSKATDASYENGDKIGVYVSYQTSLAPSGNYVNNKAFTLEDGSWEAEEKIYWADKTNTADFYCYYPYGTPVNATAYNFAVRSDQSTKAAYAASDFLWGRPLAVAPGPGTVAITTAHIMSNILVYLAPGEGFTAEEFAAAQKVVKLGNVKNNAVINLASGGVSATGDTAVITPYWTGECYRAVVVPQSVAADANLIILTINNVSYTLAREFRFEPRTQHKLTVTVNKTSSGLNLSIESWIIDDNEYTGDAH